MAAKRKTPKPSIRTVSRLAGVSPTTVSMVLNNSSVPTEKTRQRVLEAVKATGYSVDPLYSAAFGRKRKGASKQDMKTSTIGYLTYRNIQRAVTHADGYYHDVLTAVSDTVQKSNYYVMFANVEVNDAMIPGLVTGNRVDGLVIQAELEPSVRQLLPTRLPVVFIDRTYPEIPADSVVVNYAHGVHQILDYLWNLGHRNIALFTDQMDRYYNEEYHAGYRRFYRLKGMSTPCPQLSVAQVIRPETNDQVYAAYIEQLMAMSSRPTAIVFSGNGYAAGMFPHLLQAGLRVPADISLACLCDMRPYQEMDVSLTSYHVPMTQIGQVAAELLLKRIEDPSCTVLRLAINGRLIERTSCGPAPVTS